VGRRFSRGFRLRNRRFFSRFGLRRGVFHVLVLHVLVLRVLVLRVLVLRVLGFRVLGFR
jgi:hypothetical protein